MIRSPFPLQGIDPDWFQIQLFESSPFATLLLKPEPDSSRILYSNKAFEKLTGYTRDDVIDHSLSTLKSLFQHAPDFNLIQENLQTRDNWEISLLQRRKDGQEFWVEIQVYPIRDHNGEMIYWVMRQRDITQLRDTFLQLQASQIRYRTLFEESADAVFIIDDKRDLVDANAAACHLFGYSHDELLRMKRPDLLLAETPLDDERIKQAILEHRPIPIIETHYKNRQGTEKILEVHLSQIPGDSNSSFYIQALLHDITARKAYETEIQHRSKALETANNAVVLVSLDLKVEWCNEAYLTLTGYSRADLYGHRPMDVLRVDEQSEATFIALSKVILVGQVWRGQIRHRHRDGHLYTVYQTITPLKDAKGQIERFIGVLEDITEKTEVERALHRSAIQQESLLMTMAEGVVMHAADGAIEFSNPAAERMLGLTQAQMRGHTSIDPLWRTIHEDGSLFEGLNHPAMVTLRTGKAVSNVIMGVHKPDDSLTWILINTEPIFLSDLDHPSFVVASFTDITATKQAQAQAFEAALEQ